MLYRNNNTSAAFWRRPLSHLRQRGWPLRLCAIYSVIAATVFAQTTLPPTTLNLQTQGRNADLSTYTMTRTMTVGTALPSVCVVGQLFFNSAAAAGSNIFGCTATNIWTLQSGTNSNSTGTGVVTTNPAALTFGSQASNTRSPSQSINLLNTGSVAVSIAGVNITGTNRADFTQNNTCGSNLAAGASCAIAVTFTPSLVGSELGSLSLSDSAANSPQIVTLSGAGAASGAAVTLTPTGMSFATTTIGTTTASQTVTLLNSGSSALLIASISTVGPNGSDFAQTNNCPSSLAAGASCTLAVTFTPTLAGSEIGYLSFSDPVSGSPQSVTLTGTGASASAQTPALTPAAPVALVNTPLTLSSNRAVAWSLASGSAGSLSSTSATSVTYTPPSTLRPLNAMGGCLVQPNDSVFNTRIDNLPVNANSASWVTSMGAAVLEIGSAWGTNLIDNTLAATNQVFHYTTGVNPSFQIPPAPSRKRETGSLTTDPTNDHHLLSLNRQTCHFYETYQDGIPVSSCPNCTAASGWQYDGASYTSPTFAGGGSTDAAGLPLEPLLLHLSEIEAGSVNHALRFTLCTGCINNATYLWPASTPNGSATPGAPPMGARFRLKASFPVTGLYGITVTSLGSGYTSAPTVTVTGCAVAPTASASVSGGFVQSIAITNMGSGCTNPTVSISGVGSGATATAVPFSAPAQTILRGLQQYGLIVADNGPSGQVQTATDVTLDPNVVAALNQINLTKVALSNFEAVDESTLMVTATSYQVNPTNPYVTPAAYAILTATDGSGNRTTVPIAIQPVTVGLPYTGMTFVAGGPAYQLQSWINGSSNQGVIWTLTSGPGSVTAGGLYTPPASATTVTPVVLTAAATADATATSALYATVVPTGTNPTGAIRIDVGNSNSYTDAQGNIWQPDTVASETAAFSLQNDNYPVGAWGSLQDAALYQTYKYTFGDDMAYGPFVVPNGNYKIGLFFAHGSCAGTFTPTPSNNGLIDGPVAIETQARIQERYDYVKASNNTCRTPVSTYVPAQVTNNLLYFVLRATGGANTHTVPYLNAFSIAPDATPAFLAIDTQQVTTVTHGTTAQLYATGWYMSNAVTWSVSGGGSIDQNGLYTAPATAPSGTQTVTVTATSTVTPSITATATLTIQ